MKAAFEKKAEKSTVRVWTAEEDALLLEKMEEGLDWIRISRLLLDKNPLICARRAGKLKKKLSEWSNEKEKAIKRLKEVEHRSWAEIQKLFPGKDFLIQSIPSSNCESTTRTSWKWPSAHRPGALRKTYVYGSEWNRWGRSGKTFRKSSLGELSCS